MYVVRRAFRNYGQMMTPGSVVEPGTVKRFKSRLNDGRIVEVSEQNFDKWDEYFKVRVGVSIQKPDEAKPDEAKPDEAKPDEAKPAATAATAVTKPATKPIVVTPVVATPASK